MSIFADLPRHFAQEFRYYSNRYMLTDARYTMAKQDAALDILAESYNEPDECLTINKLVSLGARQAAYQCYLSFLDAHEED